VVKNITQKCSHEDDFGFSRYKINVSSVIVGVHLSIIVYTLMTCNCFDGKQQSTSGATKNIRCLVLEIRRANGAFPSLL